MNNLIGDLERRCQEEHGERVLMNRRAAAHRELNVLLAQNETYWHQQSRISWLREGDRNTKFFHAIASHHCQKNVKVLKGMDGRIFNDQDSMAPIAEQYFQEIFRT